MTYIEEFCDDRSKDPKVVAMKLTTVPFSPTIENVKSTDTLLIYLLIADFGISSLIPSLKVDRLEGN